MVSSPEKTAPSALPEERVRYFPVEAGHSDYGRSTLEEEEQAAYDRLAAGILARAEEVELTLSGPEKLNRILLCIRRDYPIISWMSNQYSYRHGPGGGVFSVHLEYTKSPEEIARETQAVWEAGQRLSANLDPGLTEFDRALILYDRLCGAVEYDRFSPAQRELSGALVDGRATCEGYAKAYQYLLSLAGIQALTVYGEAEEPHAWNILRLDGEYYHADPTYGDVLLPDGRVFLSHAYLFLDDRAISSSHTAYQDERNYPVPLCSAGEADYFRQKGTLISAASREELTAGLEQALGLALANGYNAVQIRLEGEALPFCQELLDSGELDGLMVERGQARGAEISSRSFDEHTQVLSYLLE